MKNLFKTLVLALALLAFAGCGGGGDSSTNEGLTQIKVIDGYIKNAEVRDSAGQVANYDKNGVYSFSSKPQGNIYVYGGSFEDSDVKNKFDYIVDAKYSIISPLTHFVTVYPEQKENLIKSLNLSEDDLNQDFIEKLKGDKEDQKWQNIAKTAQIFYALETNDLLKDLKDFDTFDKMKDKALELAKTNQDASNLINQVANLSADGLIKAESNLASIKTSIFSTSTKESGIRLDGKWKMIVTSSNCDQSQRGEGTLKIEYDKSSSTYTLTSIVNKRLLIGDSYCEVKDVSNLSEYLRTETRQYHNVKYPLPISEFNNSIELSRLLTDIESNDSLHAEGLGVKLLSPDKFTNTSKNDYGTTTATYTRIK